MCSEPAPRPALPDLLRLTAADGTRGVFLLSRCHDCGAVAPGIRRACPSCASRAVATIESAGDGTLVSYTLVHRAAQGWTGRVPYALGEVALRDGGIVCAEIVGADPARLRRGQPMLLALERIEDGAAPPLVINRWTPAGTPA